MNSSASLSADITPASEQDKGFILSPVLGTLAILVLVALAVFSVHAWETEKQKKAFTIAAGGIQKLIENRMLSIRFELESTKRFFQGSSFVNRKEFRSFVIEPINTFPEILDIVWVVPTPSDKRETLENKPWNEGLGGHKIFRIPEHGSNIPIDALAIGNTLYPIVYAEPQESLTPLVGLDISTLKNSAAFVDQALRNQTLTSAINAQILPAQHGTHRHDGIILSLFQPILPPDAANESGTQASADVTGVLTAQLDLKVLFEEALKGQDPNMLSFYLTSNEGESGSNKVVYHHLVGDNQHSSEDHSHPLEQAEFHYAVKLDILGRPWTLAIEPMAGFFEGQNHYLSLGALMFGILFTTMSSIMLFANKRQTDTIHEKVEQQTQEIVLANASLEHEIKHRHAQLRELRFLENAIDEHAIVSSTDESGNITYVNDKFCQISGYTQDELIGKNPRILKSDVHDKSFYQDLWNTISSGNVWRGDLNNIDRHGNPYWVRTTIVPNVNEEGIPFRFFSICTEITENINLESDLRASKHEADKANQAKSEFLSSMSHELRTPLNAILGFAQMLEFNPSEPLKKSQKESVDLIIKGGKHLLELINEVLDLAKIESGKMELSIEVVEVKTTLDECLTLIETMAQGRNIDVTVGPGFDEGLQVLADHMRFKQVLLNLMSNAVKYNCENGKVIIDCGTTNDSKVKVSISDTGRGIPEDRIEDLFAPFSRLGAENSDIEGTGVGLTITKQLLERMGGSIEVSSKVGEGSTFTITLPQYSQMSPQQTVEALTRGLTRTALLPKIPGTVLYVEDNPANLKLMEMIVERIDGMNLITAHTAELGLEYAKLEHPDLIVLDINLPGMDGFEAMKRLKSNPETQTIPVIALSANAMRGDVRQGMLAGFRYYLTKPIQVDEIINVFQAILLPKT